MGLADFIIECLFVCLKMLSRYIPSFGVAIKQFFSCTHSEQFVTVVFYSTETVVSV